MDIENFPKELDDEDMLLFLKELTLTGFLFDIYSNKGAWIKPGIPHTLVGKRTIVIWDPNGGDGYYSSLARYGRDGEDRWISRKY